MEILLDDFLHDLKYADLPARCSMNGFAAALDTVRLHQERILQRWTSTHTNARLEALNGLFQLVRARAHG